MATNKKCVYLTYQEADDVASALARWATDFELDAEKQEKDVTKENYKGIAKALFELRGKFVDKWGLMDFYQDRRVKK